MSIIVGRVVEERTRPEPLMLTRATSPRPSPRREKTKRRVWSITAVVRGGDAQGGEMERNIL